MGSEKKKIISVDGGVKVIEWEDFEQELARLWSLSSALKEAKEKKESLHKKLDEHIQRRTESVNRLNVIEEMREKLEAKELVLENLKIHSVAVADDVKIQQDKVCNSVRSLLVSGKALSVASKNFQEAKRLIAGERGNVYQENLQKMLRMRLQCMVAQVSSLYPVRASVCSVHGEKHDPSSTSSRLENSVDNQPTNPGTMTILGLPLIALPLKKISIFINKEEVQRSASALGYVAHAVSLIASYIEIPLRYPLHFGGSHSYIHDYAPSTELASSISASTLSTNTKPIRFPLFLEGQDTTEAAYAIFLLNKDLEQLLNFFGVQSLGPRHVLANLKELFATIQSQGYIQK